MSKVDYLFVKFMVAVSSNRLAYNGLADKASCKMLASLQREPLATNRFIRLLADSAEGTKNELGVLPGRWRK